MTEQPPRVRRQPDHPVRQVGDRARGSVTAAAGGRRRPCRRRRRRSRPRWPPTPAPGGAGGARQVRLAVLHAGPSSSSRCQVASTRLARPAGAAGAAAGDAGRARRGCRARRRATASSRRAAAASGRPRCTSIWSAIAASTRRSLMQAGHLERAPRTSGPRPSQLTNVPAFSATAATGSTTSARSVTALARCLQADDERGVLQRGQRRGGVGQVVRVDAGRRPARRARRRSAAARMPVVSRPGASGSEATFQARATSARAVSSSTGRPIGSRLGSAPASMAPRSPARRGIQASRAPVEAAPAATARTARRARRPAARRPG